jgi:nucleotide-binding universal stress UspA family protein
MENILVAIDGKHGAWEALSRACSLARRVHVQLSVLLVIPSPTRNLSYSDAQLEATVRERLELLLEAIKAEGIRINYFVTEGVYEEEVMPLCTTTEFRCWFTKSTTGTRAARTGTPSP